MIWATIYLEVFILSLFCTTYTPLQLNHSLLMPIRCIGDNHSFTLHWANICFIIIPQSKLIWRITPLQWVERICKIDEIIKAYIWFYENISWLLPCLIRSKHYLRYLIWLFKCLLVAWARRNIWNDCLCSPELGRFPT